MYKRQVGSLPKCIDKEYYDVRVILPKYVCMSQEMKDRLNYRTHFYMDFHWQNQYVGNLEAEMDGVKYYFIDNEYYFNGFKPYGDNALFEIEKFAFFSKAALSILPVIDFRPDLIHCHDWQTGLIPVYLHERFQGSDFYRGIKTAMTIHNLKFQGKWKMCIRDRDDSHLWDKYVRVLRDGFVSMDMAQNILVIKTVSGMAMAVAAAVDAMKFREIVGSIAGDDTIMMAVRSVEDTRIVMDKIREILEK